MCYMCCMFVFIVNFITQCTNVCKMFIQHHCPLSFTHFSLFIFLLLGSGSFAPVGGLVFTHEASRWGRRPWAASLCPPLKTLLFRFPERQPAKRTRFRLCRSPSPPHILNAPPASPPEPSSSRRCRRAYPPSPQPDQQRQQQRQSALHRILQSGRSFAAILARRVRAEKQHVRRPAICGGVAPSGRLQSATSPALTVLQPSTASHAQSGGHGMSEHGVRRWRRLFLLRDQWRRRPTASGYFRRDALCCR